MSKIEQLIKEKCPNGVEYKQIKDVFTLFSGMRGVSSKWADNGNCRFIDYMNAYNNNKIDVTKLPFATVKNLNQNTLQQGDILLTSASEIPDECAISSVIEDNINDGVFMDDHLFGLRINDEYVNIVNTTFINYYLSSTAFRENLYKAVRGVTRFYISNNDFVKLKIPIPPIEVQEEIVKILDKFSELETELEAELEAELETRKNQYKFWLEKLFNKNNKFEKLKDIADIYLGLTHTPTYVDNGIKFISSANISKNFLDLKNVKYISEKEYKEMTPNAKPQKGDILFVRVGSNLGHPVIFNSNEKIGIFVSIGFLRVKDTKLIDNKYLKYWMNSNNFMSQVKSKTQNAPKANLNSTWMREFKISIPPLQEQERIVKILDKFDKLINDISEGIPAEIEARRKQYEYYRNKLLSFEELKTNE